eukprot:365509-Chlamydomonas_euryale.AAC.17
MQIKTSLSNGLALGSINAVLACSYAAAFFYGTYAVYDFGRDGGRVLTAVFAALIGGFALGMLVGGEGHCGSCKSTRQTLYQCSMNACIQAAPSYPYFIKGTHAGARLFHIIKRKPEIDVHDGGMELKDLSGCLELQNISFSYPAMPERTVIRKCCEMLLPWSSSPA